MRTFQTDHNDYPGRERNSTETVVRLTGTHQDSSEDAGLLKPRRKSLKDIIHRWLNDCLARHSWLPKTRTHLKMGSANRTHQLPMLQSFPIPHVGSDSKRFRWSVGLSCENSHGDFLAGEIGATGMGMFCYLVVFRSCFPEHFVQTMESFFTVRQNVTAAVAVIHGINKTRQSLY